MRSEDAWNKDYCSGYNDWIILGGSSYNQVLKGILWGVENQTLMLRTSFTLDTTTVARHSAYYNIWLSRLGNAQYDNVLVYYGFT